MPNVVEFFIERKYKLQPANRVDGTISFLRF